jgi:cytochrome c peroxidase
MVRRILCALVFLFCAGGVALGEEGTLRMARKLFKPIPHKPPLVKPVPAIKEKIGLGKMLFFEPRLSSSYLLSCNTCHNVGLGGADLEETSIGHGWQKGARNAPTVFNAVFNTTQFWDGRAKDLAEQAKGPVQASVEMNNTPARVVETLKSIPEYVKLFKKAFPGESDPVTFDNMATAIEAFEATLLTPDSRFDLFLKGKFKALDPLEMTGLELFMSKGCANCHSGINVGGNGYYPFGVVEKPEARILPPEDTGRFKVTNTEADHYVFKAPALRNVALTPPYFHSGQVWKLQDAVSIMGSAQLGIHFEKDEAEAIATFLATLTGKQPKLEYPILPPTSNTTPRPSLK